MSFMDWFRRSEKRETVNPVHPRDPVLAAWFGGDQGGTVVTPDSAMRVTAVYACVSLIAEMIAALPLHVYKRDGATTSKAKDHPLYPVVHSMPTVGLTKFEWLETQITHTALRGDSFARIVMDKAGKVQSLPLIMPAHIQVDRVAGKVRYKWTPDGVGPTKVLLDDEVLRIPFKMLDGFTSLSPIELHRKTIGTTMAAGNYLNAFYKNNAAPKGGLKFPQILGAEAVKALRDSWESRHAGPENAGRLAIFDGGMEWTEIGMKMEDAQYVELQQFSIQDIARIFLVPPHKIGDLSHATFSNIEHQAIQFVTDTLNRWCKRIEARMNAYLLSEADRRGGYFIEFDLKGLLAGDSAARAAFYQALFYIGAINPNEIRAAENLNPYEGGDRYFIQGASVPIDKIGEQVAQPAPVMPQPDDNEDQGDDQGS